MFARIRQANPGSCLRLPNGERWPGERVLDHLTVKSDSQFMFPTLAIGFVDTPYFSPERQLKILLEAPPSGAFSALDNLYYKILSRRPPAQVLRGEEDLREYQEVVMGILRVIIAWSGKPLSAADIAVALDKPPDVVQRIVRGPMRTLFKFHTSRPDSPITLCHKSLRDYLLTRDRSQEFFIPSAEEDDLFIAILSRRPTSHPAHANIQGIVMDVLSFVRFSHGDGDSDGVPDLAHSVSKIAEFLDVDFALVNYVINIGPTRLLFGVVSGRSEEDDEEDDEEEDEVRLCTESFGRFLKDPDRSGPFFPSNGRTDALFIQALSRPPPSGSPYSYSRDILLDILATLLQKWGYSLTISHIAALLEVDYGLVKHVVTSGPVQWLVSVHGRHAIGLINDEEVSKFMMAGNRSREFFVSPRRLDPVFIRILSKNSPSESSSHSILMDVLTAMLVVREESTIHQIASFLGIDHTLVEGVVKLTPTNLLFRVDQAKVSFSFSYFDDFLMDGSRSGPFFISTRRVDALIVQSLSRRPPPDSSSPYSRDVFLDILAMSMTSWLSLRQIAAFLDVDPSLAQHVVKFGTESWMFQVVHEGRVDYEGTMRMVGYGTLRGLLLDADRSGPFFISDRRLDPYFVEMLSRPSPIDPPQSELSWYDIVLRVLATILGLGEKLTIQGIASVIGVDPVCVESVVTVGPTKLLFAVESWGVTIVLAFLKDFLQDATRSGKFFVSRSDIDAIFLRILRTSSPTVHPHPQQLLMDVLSVMIMMDDPYATIDHVAAFLDIDSVLVDGVVSGPAKQLFQVESWGIYLSTKLLGLFLQDVGRAGDFCITEARMDDLFTRFISRQLPPDLPHSHAQHILKNVLCVLAHSPARPWTVSRLSAFLDMDYFAFEGVVYDPSGLLFNSRWPSQARKNVISLSLPSPPNFWNDANRSGKFFISDNSLDPFFLRILSSPLPPTSSHSRPQNVLRDVLTLILVTGEGELSVSKMAEVLDVKASIVDSVVQAGLPRLLFSMDWGLDTLCFSTTSIVGFLRDAERSGEFCITDAMIDALFIRILSHPPPSHLTPPPSKSDILRVMAVILASTEPLTVYKIGALLGVDCTLVEGAVEIIPANVLFRKDQKNHKIEFNGPFIKHFLHDPNRSGEFFIPPTITLDDIPKLWPQHSSNSPEVPGDETGRVCGDVDEEMKDRESAKGDSAWQSGAATGSDTPYQSPLAIQTMPASALPKRKLSRLASSRQTSRDSANEVAASPSTPVRTKRSKRSGSFVLDSDELQELDNVGSDADVDEAMIMEGAVVDDEDVWDAEAVGDDA